MRNKQIIDLIKNEIVSDVNIDLVSSKNVKPSQLELVREYDILDSTHRIIKGILLFRLFIVGKPILYFDVEIDRESETIHIIKSKRVQEKTYNVDR